MKTARNIWYSISGRLTICLVVAIFGMGAILLHTFYSSWNETRNEAYEEFNMTSGKMQAELTAMFDSYKTIANITGYSAFVQQYLLFDNPETVIKSFSSAMNYLDNVLQLSDNCLNVFLYSSNGRHLYANNRYADDFRSILERRGFDQDTTISRPFFVPMPGEEDSPYVFYMVPVYNLSSPSPDNPIIVAVLCDMSGLIQTISTFDETSPDATVLMYSGSILSSSRALSDSEKGILSMVPEKRSYLAKDSVKYLTNRISTPEDYWDFIYFIPERAIFARALQSIYPGLLPLCSVFLGISIFLILLVHSVNLSTRQIVGDINRLTYDSRRVGSSYIRIPNLIELQAISQSTNRMLARLDEAFRQEQQTQKQLYEAIHAQSRAEMASYRSQINPHFLFNTLECVRSLAHRGGESMIETLISSMALMFRYSLYSSTMVPLSQEISHVRHYMNVLSIRFPERYALHISVQAEAADYTVLSMILQPIVENASKHAFGNRDGLCTISVRAFLNEKQSLVVRVADNGCGLTDDEIREVNRQMRLPEESLKKEKSSIALQNIFRRMKLTFGDSFHICFYSKKGYYTVVEMTIPELPNLPPFETR